MMDRPPADSQADAGLPASEFATLGGGCFWCLEAVYEHMAAVRGVQSGYAGGHVENPTYEQVCGGQTGHAEVVRVEFDPTAISYQNLLGIFFSIHDPTTPDRQGADVGPQYRSAIFTESSEQEEAAHAVIAKVNEAGVWDDPIVTEVAPLEVFYPAEAYHDAYFSRNQNKPYCAVVIAPKVAKFRERFAHLLR